VRASFCVANMRTDCTSGLPRSTRAAAQNDASAGSRTRAQNRRYACRAHERICADLARVQACRRRRSVRRSVRVLLASALCYARAMPIAGRMCFSTPGSSATTRRSRRAGSADGSLGGLRVGSPAAGSGASSAKPEAYAQGGRPVSASRLPLLARSASGLTLTYLALTCFTELVCEVDPAWLVAVTVQV
jgi:hypothetical protein